MTQAVDLMANSTLNGREGTSKDVQLAIVDPAEAGVQNIAIANSAFQRAKQLRIGEGFDS